MKEPELKNHIKKPKPDEVIEVMDLLSKSAKDVIKSFNVKDTKLKSEKQLLAEKNYFLYQEISGRIYLHYDHKHYLMPKECNSDLTVFKAVLYILVDIIEPTADKSIVPKVE